MHCLAVVYLAQIRIFSAHTVKRWVERYQQEGRAAADRPRSAAAQGGRGRRSALCQAERRLPAGVSLRLLDDGNVGGISGATVGICSAATVRRLLRLLRLLAYR